LSSIPNAPDLSAIPDSEEKQQQNAVARIADVNAGKVVATPEELRQLNLVAYGGKDKWQRIWEGASQIMPELGKAYYSSADAVSDYLFNKQQQEPKQPIPPLTAEEREKSQAEAEATGAETAGPAVGVPLVTGVMKLPAQVGRLATNIADMLEPPPQYYHSGTPEGDAAYKAQYFKRQADNDATADLVTGKITRAANELAAATGQDPNSLMYQLLEGVPLMSIPLPLEFAGAEKIAAAVSRAGQAGSELGKVALAYAPEYLVKGSAIGLAAHALGVPGHLLQTGLELTGAGAELGLSKPLGRMISQKILGLSQEEVLSNVKTFLNAPKGIELVTDAVAQPVGQEITRLNTQIERLRGRLTPEQVADLAETAPDGTHLYSSDDLTGAAKQVRLKQEQVDDLTGKLKGIYAQTNLHKWMNGTAAYVTNMAANTAVAGGVGGLLGAGLAPTGQGVQGFVSGTMYGASIGAALAPLTSYSGMHNLRLARGRAALTEMGRRGFDMSTIAHLSQAQQDQVLMVNGYAQSMGRQVKVVDPATTPDFPSAVPQGAPEGAMAMPANGYIDPATGDIILNKNAIGEGTAYHELRHVMQRFTGQMLREKAPEIMEPFEKAYAEASGDPNFNRQAEMDAEIGRIAMMHSPIEGFYGGERPGDHLARLARGIVNYFTDNVEYDPTLKVPYTKADIETIRQQMFKLGEHAQRQRFIEPVIQPEAGAPPGRPPPVAPPPGPPPPPAGPPLAGQAPGAVAHPADGYASVRAEAEQAYRQANPKATDDEITNAGIAAAAQAHAQVVGPDSDLITWKEDKFGKKGIWGKSADPTDPFHQMLIDSAKQPDGQPLTQQAKDNLNLIEAKMGEPVTMDYQSAPKKAQKPTKESRIEEQAAAPVAGKVAGTAPTQMATKSVVPKGFRYNLPSRTFSVHVFSPDKFVSNAAKVIEKADELGITDRTGKPFYPAGVNDPLLVQDFRDMSEHHDNGFSTEGKPITGTDKYPVTPTPGYKPERLIPRDRAELLNAMLGDTGARKGVTKEGKLKPSTPEQAAKQELARENAFLDPETGETNLTRQKMEAAGLGKLESVYETLSPEGMRRIRDEPAPDQQTLRPAGFEGDRRAFTTMGLPRPEFTAASLMPATRTPTTPEELSADIGRNKDEGVKVVASTPESETIELGMNKQQMMALVGPQMYDKPIQEVTAKELLQNAFDASRSAGATMKNPMRVDITTDPSERTITVKDSGAGMDKDIIKSAFFTVGGTYKTTDPSNTSGGLGLAKMAFMLGSDRVRLETVKDGFMHIVDASSDQIRNGTFKIDTAKTSEPNGTSVTVKIPESYTDSNGETKSIYFNEKPNFLTRPLFGPVEVALNGDVLPIGVHQTGYQPDNVFNFSWGKINVYVDPKKTEYPNFQVLSAGLHQFSLGEYEIYGSSYEDTKMPYNFVLDVRPKVKTDNPAYPFNNQREGFRGTIKDDIEAMKKYFQNQGVEQQLLEAKDVFANLKQMADIDPTENLTQEQIDRINAQYAASQKRAASAPTRRISRVDFGKENVVIHYDDGSSKTEARQKYVEKSFKPEREVDIEKTGLDVGNLDPNKPLLHNNTNAKIDEIPEAPELNTKLGNALIKFMREFGDKVGDDYEDLGRDDAGGWFGGISYDKDYRGLNMVKPFKSIWFNPGLLSSDAMHDPEAAASETLHIFIHEITHVEARSEGARFTAELANNYARLRAYEVPIEKFETSLANIYAEHWDAINDITSKLQDYNTKNRAASFKSAAALGPERPPEAEGIGEGAPPVDVPRDERVPEQGRPGAGGAAAPDPAAGPIGEILAGQAAGGGAPTAPVEQQGLQGIPPPTEGRQLMPSAHPDAIKEAAIKHEDGTVEAGASHYDITGGLERLPGTTEGFVTNNGEFLDRDEAYQRALKFRQIPPEANLAKMMGLASEDLPIPEGITPEAHAILSDPAKDLDLSKEENFGAVNRVVPVKGSTDEYTMVDSNGQRYVGQFDHSIVIEPKLEEIPPPTEGRQLMPAKVVKGQKYLTGIEQMLRGEKVAPTEEYYIPSKLLGSGQDPKTVKGEKYGYTTYIAYMAAHDKSGVINVCKFATTGPGGCVNACLANDGQGALPVGMIGRINKTKFFNYDPETYMAKLDREITNAKKNLKPGQKLSIRLNGTSDLPWEKLRFGDSQQTMMERHPDTQFYDYSKYPDVLRDIPENYHLTYSYTGKPGSEERSNKWAEKGVNTAVVFRGGMPAEYLGRPVVDGDTSDLRFLDPEGVIVGLHAKGKALRKDKAGNFIEQGEFVHDTPPDEVAIPFMTPARKGVLKKKLGEAGLEKYIDKWKDNAPKAGDLKWKRGNPLLGENPAAEEPVKGYKAGGVVEPDSGVYLIRHGCTALNEQSSKQSPDVIRGHANVPLDEKGKKQALKLGKDLAGKGIHAVYTSDLSRAVDTGAPVAQGNGAHLIPTFGLRPWDLGRHTGKPTKDVQPQMEHLIDHPDEPAEGGESFNQFKDRFLSTMHGIVHTNRDKKIAVVTHYRGTKLLGSLGKNGELDNEEFKRKDGALEPAGVQFLSLGENNKPMKGIQKHAV
jgi:broad specificity phosphatase PhoE